MFSYNFPRPALTVDVCLIYRDEFLLIKRNSTTERYPDHWALPGGFVNFDERWLDAAHRELEEETGIPRRSIYLEPGFVYDDPKREAPDRIITRSYCGRCLDKPEVKAGDDAVDAEWFDIDEIVSMKLAFDHNRIVTDAHYAFVNGIQFVD